MHIKSTEFRWKRKRNLYQVCDFTAISSVMLFENVVYNRYRYTYIMNVNVNVLCFAMLCDIYIYIKCKNEPIYLSFIKVDVSLFVCLFV